MPLFPFRRVFGRAWWGLFGLLIAVPAIALSWLGLRAVRAERLEGEEQLRRQHVQISQLADAAIVNTLAQIEAGLRHQDARPAASASAPALPSGVRVVRFDRSGLVTFPADKLYLGQFGRHPPERVRLTDWTPAVTALIERAQSAEIRRSTPEALALFDRLVRLEPRLKAWADMSIARLRLQAGDVAMLPRLASAEWARSDGVTPSGLPVALVACASSEGRPPQQRGAYAPLVERSIASLQEGRWWLSADERRFYGTQLRALLTSIRPGAIAAQDSRLFELIEIEQIVRQFPPSRRNGSTHSLERGTTSVFLMVWTPAEADADAWVGAALTQAQAGTIMGPTFERLFSGQPFSGAIRDTSGAVVWAYGDPAQTTWRSEPLRTIRGWDMTFSGPASAGGIGGRQMLWYGFVSFLLVVLLVGLGTTGQIVRREMDLARMQAEFVGAVTHEFKSPITSIRLLLERIAAGRVMSAQSAAAYCGAIGQETDRLERLVNRLLEAQQIDAGKRRYDFGPASLEEVVAEAVRHLQPAAGAKNITVDIQVVDAIPAVRIDRGAITDAVENLVDNAIKYSAPATRITVGLHLSGDRVCIEVEDQGIGIERDEVPHVFDKFYRARRGDLQNVRGTGLGLALVKAAAEAHGGSVEVASKAGVGSRFSLRLPARPDAARV